MSIVATERAVSHYNIIRSTRRQAMSEETVNNRLLVSANGVGTLHWDPHPAVAAFLTKNSRRVTAGSVNVWPKEFMAKIFRKAGNV